MVNPEVTQLRKNIVDLVVALTRSLQQNMSQEQWGSTEVRIGSAIINWERVRHYFQENYDSWEEINGKLRAYHDKVTQIIAQNDPVCVNQGIPLRVTKGLNGRPSYDITEDDVTYFLGMNFCATEIANLLGVSHSTIKRRIRKFDLGVRKTYSQISDADLDQKVKDVIHFNAHLGYRSVRSHLEASGTIIPFHRVRRSLLRVDSANVAFRWGQLIKRRVYNVQAPLELWHFDGNHKLIRWNFVVHGCVDGYSRLIVYLEVSSNNRSETVLHAFKEAVREYGLPSRVRCDAGVENGKVIQYMVEQRGHDRGSALIGRSVHNQRIERTWRDVYAGCLVKYYDLFTFMEREDALNVLCNEDMFALHFTFLPLIQRSLDNFRRAFNKHPLSTERGKSPEQLYIEGLFLNSGNPPLGISSLMSRESLEDFGVEPQDDIYAPELDRLSTVVSVPEIPCPLTPEGLELLSSTVNPLQLSQDRLGVDVFTSVVKFLKERSIIENRHDM